MHATTETTNDSTHELSDEELELVVGGKDRWFRPGDEPASTMICSGNRGMSTHTELALEL